MEEDVAGCLRHTTISREEEEEEEGVTPTFSSSSRMWTMGRCLPRCCQPWVWVRTSKGLLRQEEEEEEEEEEDG